MFSFFPLRYPPNRHHRHLSSSDLTPLEKEIDNSKLISLHIHSVLYLSYFFKKNRNRYYELLNNIRIKGEFEEWIKFFINGICEISEDAITSIQKIIELKKKDMEKFRNFPNGNISNLLLVYEYLLKHPFIETEDIKNLIDVTKPTINKLLENLIDMEILELVEDKKRYRQYVYKEYVDILSEGTMI